MQPPDGVERLEQCKEASKDDQSTGFLLLKQLNKATGHHGMEGEWCATLGNFVCLVQYGNSVLICLSRTPSERGCVRIYSEVMAGHVEAAAGKPIGQCRDLLVKPIQQMSEKGLFCAFEVELQDGLRVDNGRYDIALAHPRPGCNGDR